MPFASFSSNVARNYGSGYGSGFGSHGSQYGIGPTTGFTPEGGATRSLMSDVLADQRYESDMAANALNAITNIKLGGLMPAPQAGGGGGGGSAPKQESLGSGLLKAGVGAAVSAGVGALI